MRYENQHTYGNFLMYSFLKIAKACQLFSYTVKRGSVCFGEERGSELGERAWRSASDGRDEGGEIGFFVPI